MSGEDGTRTRPPYSAYIPNLQSFRLCTSLDSVRKAYLFALSHAGQDEDRETSNSSDQARYSPLLSHSPHTNNHNMGRTAKNGHPPEPCTRQAQGPPANSSASLSPRLPFLNQGGMASQSTDAFASCGANRSRWSSWSARPSIGFPYTAYLCFARKTEGVKVFARARKDRWAPSEVYEPSGVYLVVFLVRAISSASSLIAIMEYHFSDGATTC